MKVAITAKKVVMLLMAIALAVAMVACTAAAKPGPAGPPGEQGPQGEPGTPAETPETPTTDPAGPTNAAPMLEMAFKPAYLALAGTGKMPSYTVADLNKHITDADSALRFGASSSLETVATAKVENNKLTITAKGAGSAMVTVTANDGANPALKEMIMVTVVKTNAAPTTNGLSGADRKKLEMPLYIAEGLKPFTVTIISNPGSASDSFEDAIVDDYKVEIGDKDKTTDDYVAVTVKKGTGNKHVISVTPKAGNNGKNIDVKIYPMDKFGATAGDAWTFNATINTIPKVLAGSFSEELIRGPATAAKDGNNAPVEPTATNGLSILISRYFVLESLEYDIKPNTGGAGTDTVTDEIGDTICTVSLDRSDLAVAQSLNEIGQLAVWPAGVETPTIQIAEEHLVGKNEALLGIRIDSRFKSLGKDEVISTNTLHNADGNNDDLATLTGTLTVTITCTDPDAPAVVTGKVVIR